MSTTTLHPPNYITQLRDYTNSNTYLTLNQLNNFVGAILNDICLIISNDTSPYKIEAEARLAFDESFNLQQFQKELVITYICSDYNFEKFKCSKNGFKVNFDIFYKIEAKNNSKAILTHWLSKVSQLLTNNSVRQSTNVPNIADEIGKIEYTIDNLTISTFTYGYINKLLSTNPLQYDKISSKNYIFAKQTYQFHINYYVNT